MACYANTCPKEPTSPGSLNLSSTTSPGGSTPAPENLWDGKLPQNCSSPKELLTSSNTGQPKSHPLHLYLESALPAPLQVPRGRNLRLRISAVRSRGQGGARVLSSGSAHVGRSRNLRFPITLRLL